MTTATLDYAERRKAEIIHGPHFAKSRDGKKIHYKQQCRNFQFPCYDTLGIIWKRADGRWNWIRKTTNWTPNWKKETVQGVSTELLLAMEKILEGWEE